MVSLVRVLLGVVVVVGIAVAVPPGWAPTVVTVTHGGGEPVQVDVNESFFNVSATAPAERMTPVEQTEGPVTETRSGAYSEGHEVAVLIHEKVNEKRVEHGLKELIFDEELAALAKSHSRDMAENDYFSHVSPDGASPSDRYLRADYGCPVGARENLFYASSLWSPDVLAREVVSGWMSSEGHKRNILTYGLRREGIGVVVAADGGVYVTQNFC